MNFTISVFFINKFWRLLYILCWLLICTNPLLAQGKRILFIGDSITDGNWGGGGMKASNERNHWDQNHLFGSGFMYLTAAYYMGHFPTYNLEFFNRGISGNTLDDLTKRWQTDVLDLKPDVISILIGTNDIAKFLESQEPSFDARGWAKKYEGLIAQARKENQDVQIVLCTPFLSEGSRVKNYDQYAALTDTLSRQVRQLAIQQRVTIVDFHTLFADLTNRYPQLEGRYWLWDGIHPTPAAHQQMAELWQSVVEKKIIN